MQTDAIAEVFTLQLQPQESSIAVTVTKQLLQSPKSMEPELALLLHTYKEFFDKPEGLPPKRSHTHFIPLLEGSNPVKCRPYRYLHSQKEEIKKMVQEMLQEGIIQPSSSPFSSPMILVKK